MSRGSRSSAGPDSRPSCLVTGIVSDYRREPFRMLGEDEGVEVVAFREAGPPVPGLVVHRTTQVGAARLAASGRYRAVICGLGGRIALPGSYLGARLAGIPFILWATIWAHPRTAAHALSYLPTRHLYRHADAVVTYGPHVSAYVTSQRRRGNVFEAPQAVSAETFGAAVPSDEIAAARMRAGAGPDDPLVLFVGRLEREKGVHVLLEAFRLAELGPGAVLALAGEGPLGQLVQDGNPGARLLGPLPREDLPPLYAAADVLVLPSIRTATFTEPWGLVVNEAMSQGTPVIASDAVGAAAGGLLRHGQNGLVTPSGDPAALAENLRAVCRDAELRARLGQAARADVGPFSHAAWVDGMSRALAAVGASRRTGSC
jgi:glycosyltransferase involved in cell wall biosynthesis